MNMSLRQLYHFVTVCDEKHFGRAAERLALSQPALSRSIKALEDAYGLVLLERHASGTSVTRAGEDVLRIARQILQNAAHLDETLKAEAGGQAGTVYAGIAPVAASVALSDICIKVLKSRPRIRFYTDVQPNISLHEHLAAATYDFLLCPKEFAQNRQTFEFRTAGKLPLGVIVRPDHPLAGKRAITLEALDRFPIIGAHPTPIGRQARIDPSALFHALEYLNLSCDNYDVLARVTAETDAVWISSPLSARRELAAGKLTLLDHHSLEIPDSLELAVVTIRDAILSPATRLVIDDVVETVRQLTTDYA